MVSQTPNVVLVVCDDLNSACGDMGRLPSAPTPHIDALRRRGVTFTNAYSNCPLCVPSRWSLYSGLYPHVTGHMNLWEDSTSVTPVMTTNTTDYANYGRALLRDAVPIPEHFKRHGYRVLGAGKTFHEGAVNPDWWTSYGLPPDYGPLLRRWIDPDASDPTTPLQKFLYADEPLQSYVERYHGLDRMWLTDDGSFRYHMETSIGPLEDLAREGELVYRDGSPFEIGPGGRDRLPDELATDWAIEQIENDDGRPFFLNLGLIRPHTPLNVPREYFDRIRPSDIRLPATLPGDIDDCARALVDHQPYGFLLFALATKGGAEAWKRWLHAYLACVAFVDDQIGRVAAALERRGCTENTVFIVTSDNGYHFGEKDYLFKDSLWDVGCQVPLVVSAPPVPGEPGGSADTTMAATCESPVSLIDLYPTLTEICGLPATPNNSTNGWALQGRSLLPFLTDPHAGTRPGPDAALSSVHGRSGVHHSIRSRRFRYTLCGNGEEELYDHDTDPHEWHNLADSPEYRQVKRSHRETWMEMVHGVVPRR